MCGVFPTLLRRSDSMTADSDIGEDKHIEIAGQGV